MSDVSNRDDRGSKFADALRRLNSSTSTAQITGSYAVGLERYIMIDPRQYVLVTGIPESVFGRPASQVSLKAASESEIPVTEQQECGNLCALGHVNYDANGREHAKIKEYHTTQIQNEARVAALNEKLGKAQAQAVRPPEEAAKFVTMDEQVGYWRERARSAEQKLLSRFTPANAPSLGGDLPDPPRRPDGTLAPAPRPWSAPKPGGDLRRVGG